MFTEPSSRCVSTQLEGGPSSSLRCNCYIDHATRYHPRGCYLPRSCSFGTIQGAATSQGHALLVGEVRKLAAHGDACRAVGISFIPIVVKTLGGMSASSVSTLACLGRLLGQRLGIPPADSIRHLFQRCAISLWRGNAALWIRRIPTLAPSVDGSVIFSLVCICVRFARFVLGNGSYSFFMLFCP